MRMQVYHVIRSLLINHHCSVPLPPNSIKITFRESSGKDIRTVECNEGDDLLSVAHEYDIDLEGQFPLICPFLFFRASPIYG